MPINTRLINFILLLLTPINSFANETWLQESISNEVEIDYERTCENIINVIRTDTRKRLSPNNKYLSIEQIYNRKTISISEDKVECSGYALLSNGTRRRINYGAYIDNEGDIIFNHSFVF